MHFMSCCRKQINKVVIEKVKKSLMMKQEQDKTGQFPLRENFLSFNQIIAKYMNKTLSPFQKEKDTLFLSSLLIINKRAATNLI